MKNLKLGITALALTATTAVSAQTTNNPWLIGVGAHGVNHSAIKGDLKTSLENYGPAFTLNNYKITPPLSKLTVARNLNRFFVLDWQTSVGNLGNPRVGMDKEFFLMTGLGLQFKFNGFWGEESWFDPYLRVGGNYLRHDYRDVVLAVDKDGKNIGADHFAVNGGLGINIWLTKNFGIGVQQDYVGTPIEKTTVSDFWQTSATLNFRFGNVDKDKDGVLDRDDLCPEIPGPVENNGCPWPDTDGDGVLDKDDACPEVAGPVENNGCPWPDTDGDGILDKDDACPNHAGPVENNGCPWPDTDGDGVLDKDDKCPHEFGLKEYHGCPKPKEVIAIEATGALRGITFDFAKATINPASNAKLDQAAEVIKSSNGGTFLVTGHTDKRGSAAFNLKLSRERAAAVVKALEARGVAENQLKSTGVGSRDAKVPANASNAEREQDRKVVVEAIDGSAWEALQKSDLPVVKKKVVRKKASKKRRR
ncbi:MAG: OmpA family protein [Flavobacteriaceae bacterium]|nr:OmpA family protein [Flavobacteriaceae bacterium]